tara:strand:+ start:44 stop:676 length:633 start_codon:yes stop_codon:yes gene_type:complete
MRKNQIVIYSLLFLSLLIVTFIFFYNYKNKTNPITRKIDKTENTEIKKPITKNESLKNSKVDSSVSPTIIENIEYVAMDISGNKFEINAKEGKTSSRNYDEIFLKEVVATIWLQNSEKIIITSNLANYNKNTIETIFKDNVKLNYINHEIESNKLHLLFQDKMATITNNVVYTGNNTNLYTDNIEIDFKTKKTKIFMNEKNKKVFVKSIY